MAWPSKCRQCHGPNKFRYDRTMARWLNRLKAWVHQRTRPREDTAIATPQTDSDVLAAWTPTTQVRPGHWRINALLDLPLKPHADMNKSKLWEMFIWRLAASEAKWILHDEESWGPPQRGTIDTATMQPLTDTEADAHHARMMAWWKENQEAPLRPSDPAVAVSVWLWHNGLRDQAVDVFAQIWQTVRAKQQGIPWTVDNALQGFQIAAYRDLHDNDQAEFAAHFRQRHGNPEIERGLGDLTN